MRILKDFKLQKFKFPKMKMKGISEIDEVKLDYQASRRWQNHRLQATDCGAYCPNHSKKPLMP